MSRKTLDKLAAVRYTITCAVKISFLNIKIADTVCFGKRHTAFYAVTGCQCCCNGKVVFKMLQLVFGKFSQSFFIGQRFIAQLFDLFDIPFSDTGIKFELRVVWSMDQILFPLDKFPIKLFFL